MANIRSAEKQRRQAAKARIRNTAGRSRLKSALRKARAEVAAGKADLSAGFSEIDKAAKRGLIRTTPRTATSRVSRRRPSASPSDASLLRRVILSREDGEGSQVPKAAQRYDPH